jgi:hypothetical protein
MQTSRSEKPLHTGESLLEPKELLAAERLYHSILPSGRQSLGAPGHFSNRVGGRCPKTPARKGLLFSHQKDCELCKFFPEDG